MDTHPTHPRLHRQCDTGASMQGPGGHTTLSELQTFLCVIEKEGLLIQFESIYAICLGNYELRTF